MDKDNNKNKDNKDTVIYKVPKGTQDFDPGRQYSRQLLVTEAIKQFRLFGAKPIDTPTFEREDVLMEKYGEESDKEIFRLVTEKDTEDSESLALRYDLTVPFARYIKNKGLKKLKRYQIGKVYRRDQPNMKAGRFREFLQCDYDCLDARCDPSLADAETLVLLMNVLDTTGGPNYTIRLNDRNILYGMLEFCGVPADLYGTVCSSIDKLDKKKWKAITTELEEKGLSSDIIEKLGLSLTQYKNVTWETLADVPFVPTGINDSFQKLFKYIQILSSRQEPLDRIKIDFSLARGLDYYTGIIFEVVMTQKKKKVGSIAGGGRYDELCGVPCVGFSVGIDRIMTALKPSPKREYNPTVWVVQVNPDDVVPGLYEYRLQVLASLRKAGIKTGTELRPDTGMGAQIKYVLKNEIPFIVFVGPDEMKSQVVTLKDMDMQKQYSGINMDMVICYLSLDNKNLFGP